MRFRIILIAQALVSAAFAAELPLQNFCESFNGKDCEIIWAAPTNLPASVKIFAVVPTKFSSATVSNLLQIADLKPDQRKRVDQTGVFAGKDVRFFADRKETRQLNLIPSQGFIVVSKNGALAEPPKEIPAGVPDDKEALRLALDILEKIGISRSELAADSNGKIQPTYSEESVLHKDKPSGLLVTNVVSREISLRRQIEGIPVWGDAGISVKFGNEGKLAYLSAIWRAIKPDKDCPVPDAAGFISRIKSGRVLIRSEQANVAYKKLTDHQSILYYWENSGSESQTYIYPFAVLEAKTDQQARIQTCNCLCRSPMNEKYCSSSLELRASCSARQYCFMTAIFSSVTART